MVVWREWLGYSGTLTFLDIHTSGTLADLAQARADLAIIALAPENVAAALEVAGRMACRAALVISSGIDADKATELKKIAHREGVHLLGPNCLDQSQVTHVILAVTIKTCRDIDQLRLEGFQRRKPLAGDSLAEPVAA